MNFPSRQCCFGIHDTWLMILPSDCIQWAPQKGHSEIRLENLNNFRIPPTPPHNAGSLGLHLISRSAVSSQNFTHLQTNVCCLKKTFSQREHQSFLKPNIEPCCYGKSYIGNCHPWVLDSIMLQLNSWVLSISYNFRGPQSPPLQHKQCHL